MLRKIEIFINCKYFIKEESIMEVIDNYSKAVNHYNTFMSDPDFVNKYRGKWIAVSKHGDYVIASTESRTASLFIEYYPNETQYFIGLVG